MGLYLTGIYLFPIGFGITLFYIHKHKELSLIQKGILLCFTFYLVMVIHYTLLPFPLDPYAFETVRQFGYSGSINLIPFRTSMSMKQAGLNFIMLAPLGLFVPIIFQSLKTKTILIILVLTPLLIEVIQGVGTWLLQGLWKSADINDLMLNATGAVLIYLAYKFVFLKIKRTA